MTNSITPLDSAKHAHLKVTPTTYEHVAEQHLLPISIYEFAYAAVDSPVVFVKNSETGEYQSVIMLGLKPGQNLKQKDGKWLGLYIPNVLKNYPFGLILSAEQQDKVWVGIREESAHVTTDEGNALFEGGEETAFLRLRKESIIKNFEQEQMSKAIIAFLAQKELFSPQSLTVDIKGEKRGINGIYFIDEAKLNQLSSDEFLDIKQRGLLAPIYSHLNSLHQINRLAKEEIELSA